MTIDSFTGGMFETNCFYLAESGILIDAPQESADWLAEQGHKVKLLLLTHGHIDHVWDAARIQREHGCPVGCHPETVQMVAEPDFFQRFGFAMEIETLTPDVMITETERRELGGVEFQVLEVPGHCPGSLCFFSNGESVCGRRGRLARHMRSGARMPISSRPLCRMRPVRSQRARRVPRAGSAALRTGQAS